MKVRTLGRMCISKHSILAPERAPSMYRTPSTSGEPPPAVRELSANCIAYVSILNSDSHLARARLATYTVYEAAHALLGALDCTSSTSWGPEQTLRL